MHPESTPNMSLTETQLKRLPPPEKDTLITLGDCLYLRHRPSGRKTFIIRRRVADKMTSTTIGDWPQWSIQRAKAHALGTANAALLAERIKFGEAAKRYIEEMIEARYRADTTKYAAFFVRDAATLWATPLHRVARAQLVDLIKKKHKTSPSAARKMLSLYRSFSRWATMHDLIAGDVLSVVTPSNIGLEAPTPRDRVLTADEIKQVMMGEGRWWPLMRLVLATATRIGEAMHLDAEHIAGDVWTLPTTKNGKPHMLWMTDLAKAQISVGWRDAHYATINRWLSEEVGATWRPHDLRRTAATLMREAGVSVLDVEIVLNHQPKALVQVYQRPDTLPVIKVALEKLDFRLKAYIQDL